MNYKVKLSGSVYALDPIRNVVAYARATFSDMSVVYCTIDERDPARLNFIIKTTQVMTPDTTIQEMTDGIIVGDDTNVVWNIDIKHTRVEECVKELTSVA